MRLTDARRCRSGWPIPCRDSRSGLGRGQRVVGDIGVREVGDRIATRFVQQHDVLAVGRPVPAESHPHPAALRLGEQQPLR
jgi:hypothetical protein